MIIHTNKRYSARNSPILYDYSYKQVPQRAEFFDFVRLFIQTSAAARGILRFCMIIHTNKCHSARNSSILYDYSYKQALQRAEFSDFVWFFV